MSRVKTQNTFHSYMRAAERCGWSKRKATEMMKKASRFGVSPLNMSPSIERDFLEKKQITNPHKRIKLYEGFVFVFCSTSTRCITVYKLDLERNNEDEIRSK